MMNFSSEQICLDALLQSAGRVGIAGHVKPDGDCVGACISLYLYVKTWFPQTSCDVYLEEFPDTFKFLKGTDRVIITSEEKPLTEVPSDKDRQDGTAPYDVFFCLDCADERRLGKTFACFERAKNTVCIDHHISNRGFGRINEIRPAASSTCEVLCDLYGAEKITKEMAEALYMGIAHDTGVFQYTCTSSHTMALAGMLMDKGIDYSRIISETFYAKTYLQNQLLGRALLESITVLDGKIIFSVLRLKDLKFYGAGPMDLEGIVAQLRLTRGVDAAIFLYETTPGVFRVSLRSSDRIDVSVIAAYFGGGGHMRAAGCTMQGQVHDVINNLTEHMQRQLEQTEEVCRG